MRLEYHPAVRQDVVEAMRRYKAVSQKLADDFKACKVSNHSLVHIVGENEPSYGLTPFSRITKESYTGLLVSKSGYQH